MVEIPCGEALGTVGGSEGSENVGVVWLVLWLQGLLLEWSVGLEGGVTCGGHRGSLSIGQKGRL